MKIRIISLILTLVLLFSAYTTVAYAETDYTTIGNIVKFGRYEQDNNTANGKEKIEWIVLDYDEAKHKALLISRYGLDVMPYNKEDAFVTWQTCTLRTWLNNEFMKKAFSTKEQSAILLTKVDNSRSQGSSDWGTNSGYNTEDYIFLLSYAEAYRYLGVPDNGLLENENIKSRVAPTAYAIAKGASVSENYLTEDGEQAGSWLLRSPGYRGNYAACVNSSGGLFNYTVDYDVFVVRPAFWLDLESDN